MATILEQLERAKKATPDFIYQNIFDFIRSIENEILKIQTDRLQNESKDIFGKSLGFYTYATEVISKGRKKQGEPFSANDTGAFLKGYEMKLEGDRFEFFSKDAKVFEILKSPNWLSKELFGLSDSELQNIIKTKILPHLQTSIRQILNV